MLELTVVMTDNYQYVLLSCLLDSFCAVCNFLSSLLIAIHLNGKVCSKLFSFALSGMSKL